MTDRLDKERKFRQGEGHQSAGPYVGFLPSGAAVSGTKAAIQEMHAAIWRVQPNNDCAGQSYRDFAERCDRARQEAEQRAVDATKLANELVGSRPALAGSPLNEADSGIEALYVALGQIKGINSECERHKSHPWQLQCETCRLFVARELAFQGVRVNVTGVEQGGLSAT